jgi:hypothetical protein
VGRGTCQQPQVTADQDSPSGSKSSHKEMLYFNNPEGQASLQQQVESAISLIKHPKVLVCGSF